MLKPPWLCAGVVEHFDITCLHRDLRAPSGCLLRSQFLEESGEGGGKQGGKRLEWRGRSVAFTIKLWYRSSPLFSTNAHVLNTGLRRRASLSSRVRGTCCHFGDMDVRDINTAPF